jgi:thioredoxin
MKKLILGIVIASSLSTYLGAEVTEITNVTDYENIVNRSITPVVIDFYADWCQPCKKMAPIFKELSKEYAGRVRFVKINTGNSSVSSLVEQIRSIPTFVFKKGQSTSERVGSMSKEQLKKIINTLLN